MRPFKGNRLLYYNFIRNLHLHDLNAVSVFVPSDYETLSSADDCVAYLFLPLSIGPFLVSLVVSVMTTTFSVKTVRDVRPKEIARWSENH